MTLSTAKKQAFIITAFIALIGVIATLVTLIVFKTEPIIWKNGKSTTSATTPDTQSRAITNILVDNKLEYVWVNRSYTSTEDENVLTVPYRITATVENFDQGLNVMSQLLDHLENQNYAVILIKPGGESLTTPTTTTEDYKLLVAVEKVSNIPGEEVESFSTTRSTQFALALEITENKKLITIEAANREYNINETPNYPDFPESFTPSQLVNFEEQYGNVCSETNTGFIGYGYKNGTFTCTPNADKFPTYVYPDFLQGGN